MTLYAPWLTGVIHGFDLESTGVDIEIARIVTGTWITVSSKGLESSTSWLADPGVEIPEGAAAVHGITTEHAREHGRPPAEVVAEMLDRFNEVWERREPVVIYNAPYDVSLLDREIRRHLGLPSGIGSPGPIIDPLVIDKRLEKFVRGKGGRKLINTCARYGIVLSAEDAHTSEGDTLAACRLAWKMGARAPVSGLTIHELQQEQRVWHAAQARDFAGYLRKQGKAEDADRVAAEAGTWPLRPLPAVVDSQTAVPF
jgi:DNA polymerase III subunit epsilon